MSTAFGRSGDGREAQGGRAEATLSSSGDLYRRLLGGGSEVSRALSGWLFFCSLQVTFP